METADLRERLRRQQVELNDHSQSEKKCIEERDSSSRRTTPSAAVRIELRASPITRFLPPPPLLLSGHKQKSNGRSSRRRGGVGIAKFNPCASPGGREERQAGWRVVVHSRAHQSKLNRLLDRYHYTTNEFQQEEDERTEMNWLQAPPNTHYCEWLDEWMAAKQTACCYCCPVVLNQYQMPTLILCPVTPLPVFPFLK